LSLQIGVSINLTIEMNLVQVCFSLGNEMQWLPNLHMLCQFGTMLLLGQFGCVRCKEGLITMLSYIVWHWISKLHKEKTRSRPLWTRVW
jgi:hypothetical protein